jgi:hypothetical protein
MKKRLHRLFRMLNPRPRKSRVRRRRTRRLVRQNHRLVIRRKGDLRQHARRIHRTVSVHLRVRATMLGQSKVGLSHRRNTLLRKIDQQIIEAHARFQNKFELTPVEQARLLATARYDRLIKRITEEKRGIVKKLPQALRMLRAYRTNTNRTDARKHRLAAAVTRTLHCANQQGGRHLAQLVRVTSTILTLGGSLRYPETPRPPKVEKVDPNVHIPYRKLIIKSPVIRAQTGYQQPLRQFVKYGALPVEEAPRKHDRERGRRSFSTFPAKQTYTATPAATEGEPNQAKGTFKHLPSVHTGKRIV